MIKKIQSIVVVIGDSLGAPRPWVGVFLKFTYACLLAKLLKSNYFVANYSKGQNSTKEIIKENFLRTYIRNSDISYAIVQIGIVDCAPRLLSGFDRLIGGLSAHIRALDILFKKYIDLKARHRYWLTKNFPKTLVSISNFESNYRKLINELIKSNPIVKIYIIEVAFPGERLVERSYNIDSNIREYNSVIHRIAKDHANVVEVIDFYQQTKMNPSWITSDDGHHILVDAHEWIATEVFKRISELDN